MAEAKNAATINQLKYRSRSHSGRGLGQIKHSAVPRAIFPIMHSHGTLTSIYIQCTVYMLQYRYLIIIKCCTTL